MNFDIYLREGSPLLIPAKDETLKRMLEDIFDKNQFPQDAIATEMLDDSLLETPQIMINVITKFRITPQDFAEIQWGFITALYAINVSLRARSEGDTATITYINRAVEVSRTNYLITHVSRLRETLVQDYTCADIFEYLLRIPPRQSDFLLLGITLAKLRFGAYGMMVMPFMIMRYGQIRTTLIWMGQG